MQDYLLSLFFELSQLLLTPLVLAMTGVCGWLIFLTGRTLREGLERRFGGATWRQYVDQVRMRQAPAAAWPATARYAMHRWVAARSQSLRDLAMFIREAEVIAHRRLSHLQILVRVGPMLGLVGTLIPLGPALQGLSDSDLQALGKHMNIAFTMTVFGILIGAIAYALYVVQRSWSEQDLADLELIHAVNELEQPTTWGISDDSKNQALAS